MTNCCISQNQAICANCTLHRIFSIQHIDEQNCEIAFCVFANESLKTIKYRRPDKWSIVRVCDALTLISAQRALSILGDKLFFDLCFSALQGCIVLGLGVDEERAAISLFNLLDSTIHFLEVTSSDNIYPIKLEYQRLLFQYLHLQKNEESYWKVMDLYQQIQTSDAGVRNLQKRLDAHWSASAYLFGNTTQTVSWKHKSRDMAAALFDNISQSMTSHEYFVAAKLIEHYTADGTYSSYQEGISVVRQFADASLLDDDIPSLDEAINKAIFHRDMYKILYLCGDVLYTAHFKKANDIAEQYNLDDQKKKLKKLGNDLVFTKQASPRIHLGEPVSLSSAFSPNEPYLFISYSHAYRDEVCNDVSFLCHYLGLNCWVDIQNLDGGRTAGEDDWTRKVEPVLRSPLCKGVIIYLGRQSFISNGMLWEAECIRRNQKSFYAFYLDLPSNITPSSMSELIDRIEVDDPQETIRRKSAYAYLCQTSKNMFEYSYYHRKEDHSHLLHSDFINWIDRLKVRKKGKWKRLRRLF